MGRLLENGAQNGESEDGTEAGDQTVNIDPSSSDSLSVLSHRISTDEILDEPTMDIDGEIQNNGTMPFSLFIISTGRPFSQVSPIILGTLATLVGFRVLLFEDIDLLKKWSWYYLILIIINTIILIYAGITR